MRRSVECPSIQINKTGLNAVSFRDIGKIHPYSNDNNSYVDTISDLDGVWKYPINGNSWKDDPNISYAFRHIIERTEEFYLITARTKTKRCSIFPFISDDLIEEIHSDVKTINPGCRLTVICGLEKIFNGNTICEIIMRKINQEHNVGVFGSSLRDEHLTRKTYNALKPDDRKFMTPFSTGCLVI